MTKKPGTSRDEKCSDFFFKTKQNVALKVLFQSGLRQFLIEFQVPETKPS